MKIYGIIAEYNPFHNGHKHLINELRKEGATHIVAAMSGNFVQRGDFAIVNKWARTEQALKNGIDLVIELPLPWSSSNAQTFARGGVSILDALGCVDCIGFGSECGDSELLKKTAEETAANEFQNNVKAFLQSGLSYPAAFGKAAENSRFKDILSNPNDTLALEYIKALNELNSPIRPVAVSRKGSAHDSSVTSGEFASATYLRDLILNRKSDVLSEFMPESSFNILKSNIIKGSAPADIKSLERAVLSHFRRMDENDWRNVPDVTEGLENRLYRAAQTSESLSGFFETVKTKRYPLARIRRIALHAFLGTPKALPCQTPPYIRVLGFNRKGAEILKLAKKSSSLPILHRAADLQNMDESAEVIWKLNNTATNLYNLATPEIQPCGAEYTENSIRI